MAYFKDNTHSYRQDQLGEWEDLSQTGTGGEARLCVQERLYKLAKKALHSREEKEETLQVRRSKSATAALASKNLGD
jgi:hypothetical protein